MMTSTENTSGQIDFDILAFLPESSDRAPDVATKAIWEDFEAAEEEETLV